MIRSAGGAVKQSGAYEPKDSDRIEKCAGPSEIERYFQQAGIEVSVLGHRSLIIQFGCRARGAESIADEIPGHSRDDALVQISSSHVTRIVCQPEQAFKSLVDHVRDGIDSQQGQRRSENAAAD